jgi:hypothetical protein
MYSFGRDSTPSVSALRICSSVSFDQSTFAMASFCFLASAGSAGFCAPWADAHTRRNRSWAVRPTWSTMSLSSEPGISMMTWLPPWVVTSPSVTPVALTRWSMMLRA